MRKIDPFKRREEILELLSKTPLSTSLIAIALDFDAMEVKNDLAFLKFHKLLHRAGEMPSPRSDSHMRMSIKWGADMTFTAEELEQMAYGRKHEESTLPDLPASLLQMMGYAVHQPIKGVTKYASKIKPADRKLAPMRVYPGTSFGDVALRMP